MEPTAAEPPIGDIPILGDPVRDLTVWYSDRVRDANRAALDNLRGQLLTPIDPLNDTVTRTLYGPMVLITIPLLTFGGLILGYLIMVSRTSGESAYAARSVAPRFVVGATLAILGIFLVSVIAQFVAALDAAMVGVALPASAVGGPEGWPSTGGVFAVLQQGGFDPRVAQGPDNWNSGAWLSSGLLAGILTTCLAMLNWLLGGVERLLVLAGPAVSRRLRDPGHRARDEALVQGAGGGAGDAVRVGDHVRPVQPHRGAVRRSRRARRRPLRT